MVAKAQDIRHLSVEDGHGLGRYFPLIRVVSLGDVAFVEHECDVESLCVLANPAGLVEEVAPQVSTPFLCGLGVSGITVALGVRKNDKRKGASLSAQADG